MQVILLEDVKSLGKKGTIVKVNDSYGRNYLIPKKLGVEANPVNLNNLKLQNANAEKIESMKVQSAGEIKAKIDGKTVTLKLKAGKDGKTFGSITGKEIAQAIEEALSVEVDKKKISLEEPIRAVGVRTVSVKLYKDVSAEVTVKVEEA